MPATPRETVEAETGPRPAMPHTSCVTWGWTVGPSLVPSTPLLLQARPRSDALCPRCMSGWQRTGEPGGR